MAIEGEPQSADCGHDAGRFIIRNRNHRRDVLVQPEQSNSSLTIRVEGHVGEEPVGQLRDRVVHAVDRDHAVIRQAHAAIFVGRRFGLRERPGLPDDVARARIDRGVRFVALPSVAAI